MKLFLVLNHETSVSVGIDERIWIFTAGETLAFLFKGKERSVIGQKDVAR